MISNSEQTIAVVVKRGDEWRIRKHDSQELLPQHYKTRESAERALRAIQMYKHGKKFKKHKQKSRVHSMLVAKQILAVAKILISE